MFHRKPAERKMNHQTGPGEPMLPEKCLNCGALIRSKYCPDCGQEHSHKAVSIWRLLSDFLGEVFSWDSKIIHTTLQLLFAPGLLTVEYVAGKRARYLSPFRLYLYASAAMFYLMSIQVARLPAQARSGPVTLTVGRGPETPSADAYLAEQARAPASERDPALVRAIATKALRFSESSKGDVGGRLLEGAIQNAPKCLFILLPIFAVLLKLIYARRRRLYIEHLVFALHCHAFVFVLASATVAWRLYGPVRLTAQPAQHIALNAVLLVSTAVYLLLAMKRVYAQGWIKTAIKFWLLSTAYFVLFAFAVAGAFVFALLST